jgi:uncharacterized protein YraI
VEFEMVDLNPHDVASYDVKSTAMSRRSFNWSILGGALAALGAGAGGLHGGQAVLAEESSHYRTTSSVNFRRGPSTQRSIIMVLPEGAILTSLGAMKAGFRKVSYLGAVGWVHTDFLTVSNGGSTDTPVPTGFAVTTSTVNFRQQPSTSAKVLGVLQAGTSVEVFDYRSGGFRMAGYAQMMGWISEQYLAEGGAPEGYVITSTALNLRTSPSLSASVIVVMPPNTAVRWTDEVSNGFRRVNFRGTNGWASDQYLR